MTIEQMAANLVDQGYGRDYAEMRARMDHEALNHQPKDAPKPYDCSICRGSFTGIEHIYHYHPCE